MCDNFNCVSSAFLSAAAFDSGTRIALSSASDDTTSYLLLIEWIVSFLSTDGNRSKKSNTSVSVRWSGRFISNDTNDDSFFHQEKVIDFLVTSTKSINKSFEALQNNFWCADVSKTFSRFSNLFIGKVQWVPKTVFLLSPFSVGASDTDWKNK